MANVFILDCASIRLGCYKGVATHPTNRHIQPTKADRQFAHWKATKVSQCPCTVSFLGEGSPTKVDYSNKGTLILTPLLEDLDLV